jgi:hypothetical protein
LKLKKTEHQFFQATSTLRQSHLQVFNIPPSISTLITLFTLVMVGRTHVHKGFEGRLNEEGSEAGDMGMTATASITAGRSARASDSAPEF